MVRVSAARRLKACFYDRSFLPDLQFSEGAFMLYLRHTGLAVAAKGNPWQSMVKMLFPLLSALMGDSFLGAQLSWIFTVLHSGSV